jgi:tRNA-specific adenosine deaminase 3
VSYLLDSEHACIKFMTLRAIAPSDELCIFYGSKLWFDDKSSTVPVVGEESEDEDLLVGLAGLEWDEANGDSKALIPEADLPFEKVAVGESDEDEESSGAGETSTLPSLHYLDNVLT